MRKAPAFLVFFLSFFAFPAVVRAANFYLDPANGAYKVGDEFNVAVWVEPNGEAIQTMDIIMSYDKTRLGTDKTKIKDEQYFGSFGAAVFNVDEAQGKLSLYVFSTQGSYSRNTKGKVLTITFKAKSEGTAAVSFLCGGEFESAIRNSADPDKNLIVCSANGTGSYVLSSPSGPTSTSAPTPTIVPTSTSAPTSAPTSTPTTAPASGTAATSTPAPATATPTPLLTGVPQTGFPLAGWGVSLGGLLLGLGLAILAF